MSISSGGRNLSGMALRGAGSRGAEGGHRGATSGRSCTGPGAEGSRDGRGRHRVRGGVGEGSRPWGRGNGEGCVRSGRGRRSTRGGEGSGLGSRHGAESSLGVDRGGRSRRREIGGVVESGNGRGHAACLAGSGTVRWTLKTYMM